MSELGVFRDDFYDATAVLGESQYNANAQTAGVIPANQLAGARNNVINFAGSAAAVALTTDSAANIVAALQAAIQAASRSTSLPVAGKTFRVRLINNGNTSGVITLTGGAGVTINGTNTIAIAACRDYQVTVVDSAHVTFQNVGSGTP